MRKELSKHKQIMYKAIEEIKELDTYKDLTMGDIFTTDDCGKVVNMLYLHPSITKEGWAVCIKLTKVLALPKTTSGIIKVPVSNFKEKVGHREVTTNDKGELTIEHLIYSEIIG